MKYDDRPYYHQGYLVLNQVLWGRQRVHTSSNSEPRSSNTYQNIAPALILTTGMISKKGLQVLQIFSTLDCPNKSRYILGTEELLTAGLVQQH